MASTMRPRLSPTFVWRRCSTPMMASCSPIHDEFVSTICPSSSSVPTATISQRMPGILPARPGLLRQEASEPCAVTAREPATTYWIPDTTVRTTATAITELATHV